MTYRWSVVSFISLSAALFSVADANAAAIDISDFSSAATQVSFANQPLNFGRPGPVFTGGLTFTSGTGWFRTYPPENYDGAPLLCKAGCVMTNSDMDFIAVNLLTPVAKVGGGLGSFNVATTARAEFYAGAILLGTVDIAALANEAVFAGWDAGDNLITSVRFIDTERQNFTLTLGSFVYETVAPVPVPASAWLLGSGLLGLVGAARRRKSGC